MPRFASLVGAACLALTAALPQAPAAADPFDCFTVIGDENAVDVAVCLVADALPPDLGQVVVATYRQIPACLTLHLLRCDELLCPVYASATPGVPGVVDITPEGDVYVAGTLFWDCPPYVEVEQG